MSYEDEEKRLKLKRNSSRFSNFQRDLMAGALMGGAVHTLVAPIERAKLLLQTQESNLAIVASGRRKFKGMFDCILRTVKEEGVVSLWRAGCTSLILVYPLDIAHTRLAANVGRTEVRQFRGIYHFLATIFQKDGVRGIYRGLPASIHGMVVHRGLYFGGFDTIKEKLSEESKPELVLWKRWMVAQAVTTSVGLISYPLDTVRRRMMMQSGMERPVYTSTLDCWMKIYRTEGLVSFYRGTVSNVFRSTAAATSTSTQNTSNMLSVPQSNNPNA
ncbi:unnamed protein product [Lathyrus sativus]|nr:unnamed protein product [Lathyrus sativus]